MNPMPVAELPEITSAAEASKPSLRRRIFISAVRFLFVLALGALAGGGWYLAKRGFGRSWRALVVEELHKHGVEASVRRLTLDPFHGLVAQDVRIFDYKHRENTIAQISRLSLDVNYAALMQRQPFLNGIDIRDAQVTLPLPVGVDPRLPRAAIRNLHAHIYFPPEQIYLSQADGIFCGIHISASGQLIKRKDYQPSHQVSDEEWQQRMMLFQRVVTELNKFTFETQPHLQIKFSGDLAQLENARLTGSLRAERFRRGTYQWEGLRLAGELAEQTLNLTECDWQDDLGTLKASARWHRPDGQLEFQARTSLNLRALLDAFGAGGVLADFNFLAPPRLEISGEAHLGEGQPQWNAIGRVAFDHFVYKAIPFNGANAEFSSDGERMMLRDIHLRHQSGELTAQWLDAPDDFRLDLISTIDANALRSLAPAGMREFVNDWDWPRTSNVRLAIRGSSREPATWKGDGHLQLERGRFRTVEFNSASADVHFGDGAVTYQNFRVARDEGIATGTFVYDFAHHETRVTNVRSTLRPAEAIYWIDPKLLKVVTPYKFTAPPVVTANGLYQFHGGKNTHLEINVDSPAKMEYGFLGKTLPFDRVAAKLILTDDRLQIPEFSGSIFSGAIRGHADISLAKNDERYRAFIATEGIDFPRLTNLYFNYKTAQGAMNGQYEWSGKGSDARTMEGKGEIDVRNGDVFAIPLFGPLSDLLNAVVPGVGYHVARKAAMSFTISDGVIRTSDFHVDGGIFGMVGHGDSHFLDDKIDFNVRVDASGAGVVLKPLYKFLEYHAEGSLNHPTWRAAHF
jgi:AsmA-like C-terminal region